MKKKYKEWQKAYNLTDDEIIFIINQEKRCSETNGKEREKILREVNKLMKTKMEVVSYGK